MLNASSKEKWSERRCLCSGIVVAGERRLELLLQETAKVAKVGAPKTKQLECSVTAFQVTVGLTHTIIANIACKTSPASDLKGNISRRFKRRNHVDPVARLHYIELSSLIAISSIDKQRM